MRARQLVVINIVTIVVIAALLIGGWVWWLNRSRYVVEQDAQVAADLQPMVAATAGKLTRWTVHQGDRVRAGDVLGQVSLPTGQTVNLTAPITGQVVRTSAVSGMVVAPGMQLAVIGNLDGEYVLANVQETAVRNVKPGQSVDIYLDAFPGDTFSGTVSWVGAESAAQGQPVPTAPTTGFTKEVQRIPVKIAFTGKGGKYIIPGMNASVRIHRDNV
ncbi:MAG: efflux RND transporter periplasmic adaptor subunit [Alicyclobacillus sp.]|nr:efflux RND transporter periplasmic adaptor subunit [Alicyclobacillus sp.]